MQRVLALVVSTFALGCGASGPDPGDDGSGDDDDGGDDDPASCVPDQHFCRGSQGRQCTASGNDSVVIGDCKDLQYGRFLDLQCVECGDMLGCDLDSPAIEGSLSFLTIDQPYRYPGGCADPFLTGWAGTSLDNGFTHAAYFGTTSVALHLDQFESYAGPLYAPGPSTQAYQTLDVITPTSDPGGCSNADQFAVGSPPSPGHLQVTLSGRDVGDAFSIVAQGYLSCDEGWIPVTFGASGIVTMPPPQ